MPAPVTDSGGRRATTARRPGAPWKLLAPVGLLYAIQFVGPLAFLLVMSFWPPVAGQAPVPGFTLANYESVLTDGYTLGILWRTVSMGVLVSLISLILGLPVAYGISRAPARFRSLLLLGALLPFLTSAVIRSFGWMVLLAENGLVTKLLDPFGLGGGSTGLMYTTPGLIISMVHIFLPIMILVLYGVLDRIDVRLEEAAANLGASRVKSFFLVIVPLAMPGVLAGTMLVLTLSMSSFVTPAMIAGPQLRVIATEIYDQSVNLINWPLAGAMAIVLMLIIMVISAVYAQVLRRMASGGAR